LPGFGLRLLVSGRRMGQGAGCRAILRTAPAFFILTPDGTDSQPRFARSLCLVKNCAGRQTRTRGQSNTIRGLNKGRAQLVSRTWRCPAGDRPATHVLAWRPCDAIRLRARPVPASIRTPWRRFLVPRRRRAVPGAPFRSTTRPPSTNAWNDSPTSSPGAFPMSAALLGCLVALTIRNVSCGSLRRALSSSGKHREA